MRWSARVAVALSTAACSGSSSSTQPPPVPAASCAGRAADLAAWAAKVHAEGAATWSVGTAVTPVELPDRPPTRVRAGQELDIGKDALALDGEPVKLDDLARKLRVTDGIDDDRGTVRNDDDGTPPPPPAPHDPHLLILAARDAPFDRVAAAVDEAARAGFTDAAFLFAYPRKVAPPAPSSVSKDLAAIDTDEAGGRAHRLSVVFELVTQPCAPLHDLFHQPPDADDPMRAIVDRLDGALTSCSCNVDLDALRSLLWKMMEPSEGPPLTWVGVTLVPGAAPAREITGTTWTDAAPALVAAQGQPVRLVAPHR